VALEACSACTYVHVLAVANTTNLYLRLPAGGEMVSTFRLEIVLCGSVLRGHREPCHGWTLRGNVAGARVVQCRVGLVVARVFLTNGADVRQCNHGCLDRPDVQGASEEGIALLCLHFFQQVPHFVFASFPQCIARSVASSYIGIMEGDAEMWGGDGVRTCMALHRDLRGVCLAVGRQVFSFFATIVCGAIIVLLLLLVSGISAYRADDAAALSARAGALLVIGLQSCITALVR